MEHKIAIVTGGANGIGRCITETFIKAQYSVTVIDTDAVSGERLAQTYGDALLFYRGDITEQAVMDGFVDAVIARYDKVDALVNNACLSRGGLRSCGYEDFNYVLRLGVSAPFYLTQRLMPHFNPGASVVNIASTRAFMSQPDTESYSAAKGGISALTHAMSVTLAGKARVNAISPGWIDAGAYQHDDGYTADFSNADRVQQPSGRIGEPSDIAEMALFLCSDKAGFITGENIVIDGGMTRQMIYHNDFGWTLDK